MNGIYSLIKRNDGKAALTSFTLYDLYRIHTAHKQQLSQKLGHA